MLNKPIRHGPKVLSLALSLALSASIMTPAMALNYSFSSSVPGSGVFYNATTVGSSYVADSDKIVVGMDGVVSNDISAPATLPYAALDVPVGSYPSAWGTATDVSIAQNSVFVNELGPTTQSLATYTPIYQAYSVNSGALPLASVLTSTTGLSYGLSYYGGASSLGTSIAISDDGAVAYLSIPAIGINDYIYEGTTSESMNKGIAHFDCTPLWGGNIALADHNRPTTHAFSALANAEIGQLVTYTTAVGSMTYMISSIETVATTDTSGLLQDGTNKITMYTCKMNEPSVKLKVTATAVA